MGRATLIGQRTLRGRLQAALPPVYPRAVRLRTQLLVLLATFAGTTGVAELAGAANLGTAMAFGQIAFVIALVAILWRG
jgi:superfamily II helicase